MYKANKKNSLLWLVFTLLLALSVGCAKKENQFDTPEKVAAIFWTAIKNSDAAFALVLNSDGVGCDLIKFEGRWWVR